MLNFYCYNLLLKSIYLCHFNEQMALLGLKVLEINFIKLLYIISNSFLGILTMKHLPAVLCLVTQITRFACSPSASLHGMASHTKNLKAAAYAHAWSKWQAKARGHSHCEICVRVCH